jgi:nucleoside-diphosphate-sugar epimerase
MNCLLTGSTGILGSHILFEWIRKSLKEQSVNQIFLVIRDKEISAEERLKAILNHPSRPGFLDDFSTEECLSKLTIIESDLASIDRRMLAQYNFDTVIHCAASTSLAQTASSKAKVYQDNLLLTQHLLQALPNQVKRFIYISTAFSYGIQDSMVSENIEDYAVTKFRNAYEKSKFECEGYVKQFCSNYDLEVQILRPSIICGRLLEKPYFETPKYDVFYSWAMFLSKYAQTFSNQFRIWIHQNSGLNIVPVDFVAKAILHAYLNPEIKELNIVNPKPVLHETYVEKVLQYFNINSFEVINKMPVDLNLFESLYYKSVGVVFEKYISIPDLKFNSEAILKLIEELQLDLNLGVHGNFMNLIDYSVAKQFRRSY